MKKRNVSGTADNLGAAGEFAEIHDRAQKLVTEYESTHEPHLLDEMKAIKPKLQKAIFAYSKLVAGMVPRDGAPPEVALLVPKLGLAMGYNILGGLSLHLEEYGEAWDMYEKSKQLGLELQDEKGIVQSTTALELVARTLVQSTNNLGSVALNQEDYRVALEQFQMAASYCSGLSSEDKWMRQQIEQNIERVKGKLGR